MDTIKATMERPMASQALAGQEGPVTFQGMVHARRDLGKVCFVIVRRWDAVVQCVIDEDAGINPPLEGDAVTVTGLVRGETRAPGGFEVQATRMDVLSTPAEPMPVPIHKAGQNVSLDTDLSLRPVTLRSLKRRAVFRLQEGIVRGFRDALRGMGFTEIHSPKLVQSGAEGGSNMFRLKYFDQRACLAQSPQLYKQIMVPVYERVFEVGPVFRAEKHNTARHLTEYTSLDFEMGFIDSFHDLMAMETHVLQQILALLKADYGRELQALKVELPSADSIPALRFEEAKRLVSEAYGRPIRSPYDLEPEEELQIGQYAKEQFGSDFIFITHYPSKKRPFYAMDDPADPTYTLSFDLLLRGM